MSNEPESAPRGQWIEPAVTDLPPLTDLTLQTGGMIGQISPSSALRTAIRGSLSSPLPNER